VGFFPAALIRGNRNNCTQFSSNLDWLISKLDRLESSSGETHSYQYKLTINAPYTAVLHYNARAVFLENHMHWKTNTLHFFLTEQSITFRQTFLWHFLVPYIWYVQCRSQS